MQQLLAIQDGEDPIRAYSLGYRFMSTVEIAGSLEYLRTMVECDDTLPPTFLHFTPFLQTGCKTDVGVFSAQSDALAGQVVEYHYETGELIVWAPGIAAFLGYLSSSTAAQSSFGRQFPADGMKVEERDAVMPWQPD